MPRCIVLVTGMPGSGKTELVFIARDMDVSIISMGNVVRSHANAKGIPPDQIGDFADSERKAHGYHIWAERTIPSIKGERVLIDGTRGLDEVERYRKEYGDVMKIIAVHSSQPMRFARLRARLRSDDSALLERFRERDRRELEWGIGQVIALADVMLVNEGALEEFNREARNVLTRCLSSG
jgi:dephospho-CoA kinase